MAELIEEAEAIEVGVAEVGPLRERAAAAGAWAANALAHLARFPAAAAQPKDALPAARELIQAWFLLLPHRAHQCRESSSPRRTSSTRTC